MVIKRIFSFLFFLGFALYASHIIPMEEGVASNQASEETSVVEQADIQEQQGTPKKKKKKKKKKNNNTVGQRAEDEGAVVYPETSRFLQTIKEEKSPQQKLAKLQSFASMLYAHSQIFKVLHGVRKLIPLLDELQPYRVLNNGQFVRALELYVEEEDGDRYDYYENGKKYTAKKDNDLGSIWALKIKTPESVAAALQLASLLKSRDLSNDVIGSLDPYLHHAEQEVRWVAGFVKHYLYTNKFVSHIDQMPRFVCQCMGKNVDNSYVLLDVRQILKDKVCGEHTDPIIEDLKNLPMLCNLAARCFLYYVNDGDGKDDNYTVFIGDEFRNLKSKLDTCCERIEQYKQGYEALYKVIYEEIIQTLNSIRSSKLKATLQLQYKKKLDPALPVNISQAPIKSDKILPPCICYVDEESNDNATDKEIKKTPKQQKKKKRNKPQAPRKKTAQEKKHEQTDTGSKREESNQGVIKQTKNTDVHQRPRVACKYDQRVLSWFDDAYAEDYDYESVLYHSFPLIADDYIFSLGIQTPWKNKSKPGQKDTNYSLGGEIQFNNGNRKCVVFTCCKDPNGVCYHREFMVKEKNSLYEEYFANNHWEVMFRDEFPLLGAEQEAQRFHPQQGGAQAVIEQDDDLCVKIKDNRLGVRIVLYKPYQELH